MQARRGDSSRPRVEGEREAEILDAALSVLTEVGYDNLTMDAVAARAHASKATLYRRWESKQALVVEAIAATKHADEEAGGPVPDTGSLRGDLVVSFCGRRFRPEQNDTRIVAAVISAIHTDPQFAAEYRTSFIEPKIEAIHAAYDRARARGEVRDDVDVDLFAPALAGILLHRAIVLGDPLTEELVTRVIDQIILPAATCGVDTKDHR